MGIYYKTSNLFSNNSDGISLTRIVQEYDYRYKYWGDSLEYPNYYNFIQKRIQRYNSLGNNVNNIENVPNGGTFSIKELLLALDFGFINDDNTTGLSEQDINSLSFILRPLKCLELNTSITDGLDSQRLNNLSNAPLTFYESPVIMPSQNNIYIKDFSDIKKFFKLEEETTGYRKYQFKHFYDTPFNFIYNLSNGQVYFNQVGYPFPTIFNTVTKNWQFEYGLNNSYTCGVQYGYNLTILPYFYFSFPDFIFFNNNEINSLGVNEPYVNDNGTIVFNFKNTNLYKKLSNLMVGFIRYEITTEIQEINGATLTNDLINKLSPKIIHFDISNYSKQNGNKIFGYDYFSVGKAKYNFPSGSIIDYFCHSSYIENDNSSQLKQYIDQDTNNYINFDSWAGVNSETLSGLENYFYHWKYIGSDFSLYNFYKYAYSFNNIEVSNFYNNDNGNYYINFFFTKGKRLNLSSENFNNSNMINYFFLPANYPLNLIMLYNPYFPRQNDNTKIIRKIKIKFCHVTKAGPLKTKDSSGNIVSYTEKTSLTGDKFWMSPYFEKIILLNNDVKWGLPVNN